MSSQIKIRSTRTKGNNNLTSRGLQSPSSLAVNTRSMAGSRLSPVRVEKLPPHKVNNKGRNVSTTLTPIQSKNNLRSDVNYDINRGVENPSKESATGSGDEENHHDEGEGLGDNADQVEQVGNPAKGSSTSEDDPSDPLAIITKEDPAKNIVLVLNEIREIKKQVNEIKEIKKQVVKLDSIEATTTSLAEQLSGAIKRTAKLESNVAGNSSKIRKLDEDFLNLTSKVEKQGKTLTGMKRMKEEIAKASAETIGQMNDLVDTQRQQVDFLNSGTQQLMAEIDKKLAQRDRDQYCQSLKDKAFENRHNLILAGLEENQNKSVRQLVQDFFKDSLNLKNIEIGEAVRLGSQPETDNNYDRPIIVKFKKISHRNRVWRKRGDVPNADNGNPIRIQADLPKPLREGMQILYKITRAAANIEEYASARVHDYQLEINDQIFQITDLEDLPFQLRPSTLASPKSDTHMAFFSRHTKLSNHYPSNFTINNQPFHSMEQFLALRRAELSGKEDMIYRAKRAQDPVIAKHILNALKEDKPQEWARSLEETALEGLRAKFGQNRHLLEYLLSTKKLVLGEASKNVTWGIGMDLSDPNVLDHTKWSTSGNLLGKSLMKIRAEFIAK